MTTPPSTTTALTLTRCFRPQISLVSLRAETLAVARRYDFQDRPTLQATICDCSTRELGGTFFLPFFRVIGGYSALLACLYLLIGLDPTTVVGNFVADSVESLLPLAGRLTAIWVFYCVFYLLAGSFDRDLWLVPLFVRRMVGFWKRRAFWPCLKSAIFVRVTPCSSFYRLLSRWLPGWLATGWHAGDSAQLE